jgi:putative nucleotidyltransferase with HDIG domain
MSDLRETSIQFRIFYVAYVILGFTFLGLLATQFPSERWRDVLIFTILVIAADTAQISLPRGGAAVFTSSPLDLAAIVLLGPAAAAFIEVAAVPVTQGILRRRPLIKILFNIPLLGFTVGIPGLVYRSFGSMTSLESPQFLIPLLVAGLTYYVVNSVSLSTVIGLTERRNVIAVFRQNYLWNFTHILAFLPVGAIIALIYYKSGAWTIGLFIIPLILARYTFQLYLHMRDANISTVQALTSAIDASDQYTHGHSLRVARYAVRLGRELGLTERELEVLEYGALLHDVGKIGIQHHVLRKVGKLTEEDRMILRTHPEIGADILKSVKFLSESIPIVKYHHEQPDGRGYPDGLMNEEIPIGAKIVMAADAFDAMTSDRPYRNALPMAKVIEQFVKYRGTQFDNNVVAAFLNLNEKGQFAIIQVEDPTSEIELDLQEHVAV